jgi:hypothetical protein
MQVALFLAACMCPCAKRFWIADEQYGSTASRQLALPASAPELTDPARRLLEGAAPDLLDAICSWHPTVLDDGMGLMQKIASSPEPVLAAAVRSCI